MPSAQDIIDTFDPAKGDVIDLGVLDQTTGVAGRFVTTFHGRAGECELVQPTAASSYRHVLGDLTEPVPPTSRSPSTSPAAQPTTSPS